MVQILIWIRISIYMAISLLKTEVECTSFSHSSPHINNCTIVNNICQGGVLVLKVVELALTMVLIQRLVNSVLYDNSLLR